MKEFKVGDRVRVYGANTQNMELVGEVTGLNHSGYPMVCSDKNRSSSRSYHPKQCRRLKPKRVAREILIETSWLKPGPSWTNPAGYKNGEDIPEWAVEDDFTLFREVLKK